MLFIFLDELIIVSNVISRELWHTKILEDLLCPVLDDIKSLTSFVGG